MMKKDYRIRKESIAKLAADRIRPKLIADIWDDIDDLNPSVLRKLWKILSKGQRALFAISVFENEVNNGGIHQFLFNSSGLIADQALAGFALLNAKQYVCLLEKVYSLFPNRKIPESSLQRRKILTSISLETTEKIFDAPFFKLGRKKTSTIDYYALKYVAAHPNDFFISEEAACALEAEENRKRDDKLKRMLKRDYRVSYAKPRSEIFSNSIFDQKFPMDLKAAIKAGDSAVKNLLNALTPGQRALIHARWILSFGPGKNFLSSRGQFFADIMKSLKLIGADEYAKLFGKIWRKLPQKPVQPEWKARFESLKVRDIDAARQQIELFNFLDDAFQRLNQNAKTSLESIFHSYIGSHPTEFFKNAEIGQPVETSPAVADGKFVIGSDDGNVYCFGEKKKL